MARNQIAQKDVNDENGTVTFEFANGDSIIVRPSDFPDNIQHRLALAGIQHVLGDSYASAKGSVSDAIGLFTRKYDAMKAGDFSARGEAGPRLPSVFVLAVARVYGMTEEEARAKVEGLNDEQKAAIRKHKKVQKAMLDIRQERLAEAESDETLPDIA